MSASKSASSSSVPPGYARVVYGLIGLWFGLALLKLGSPVVFDELYPPPATLEEVVHFQWPSMWGNVGLVILGVLAIPLFRSPRVPMWVLLLPAVWLAWQWLATTSSIDVPTSIHTTTHFTFVVGCFYLGVLTVRDLRSLMPVWIGIGIGLCLVISSGFGQRFGGLEATQEFYETLAAGEHPPDIQQAFDTPEFRSQWDTPSFRNKIQSRRIYATLFYPNTLAGVLLLLTPAVLAAAWYGLKDASALSRRLLPGLLGVGSLLCLIWSGSKAGWLIAMAMAGVLLLRSAIPQRWRLPVLIGLSVAGLAFLVWRNLDYFQRGATSVGARFVYWSAAVHTFGQHPLTGAGPGTFAIYFAEQKAPEEEMARLAHNDFIQQASDSGVVGFLAYLLLVGGSIVLLYRRCSGNADPLLFFLWLGLFGWGWQSLTEFGLYIPAIAWPAFFLLGVLWRVTAKPIDTLEATR